MLTNLHKQLLNDYQHDFPLSPRPYRDIADALGVTEDDVLTAFAELSDNHLISRIGPVIPPNHIGVSALVAMAVPEAELQTVADKVSAHPEVNHNYEREHRINLWFVVIASDNEHLQTVIEDIEQETSYPAMQLPMLNDFFIDLGFKLDLTDA
ncbi:Lrp/AsnC family transcriptional regulator [Candidatus Methylobacter oryzae]|uniref:siroheme decarboxylase n=1 Tax=Candidatus Methylobacter oryzae TaxID=2497749 RepID=A0ABY3CHF6_9GAMM|nr:Lrp/AsnC family transcriptional regulator [Candidatus Methylobacter oryzae]TRX02678.1 Lrp/AsnC family transcriptional regulator [Candidatus Methylobacter oryzae]